MRVAAADVSHRKLLWYKRGWLTEACSRLLRRLAAAPGSVEGEGGREGTREQMEARTHRTGLVCSSLQITPTSRPLQLGVVAATTRRGRRKRKRVALLFTARYRCLKLRPLSINYAAQCSTLNPCSSSATLRAPLPACSPFFPCQTQAEPECLSFFFPSPPPPRPLHDSTVTFSTIHSQHIPPPPWCTAGMNRLKNLTAAVSKRFCKAELFPFFSSKCRWINYVWAQIPLAWQADILRH